MVFHRALYIGPNIISHLLKEFSLSVSKIANQMLFAGGTSIIRLNTNSDEFKSNISSVLKEIMNWLK
jgi:hypothetical protein